MRKNLLHLLVGIAAVLTGISAVYFFLGNTSGVERQEIIQDIRVENETLSTIDSASGKCGEFSDEIDLTPFLNKWISGEKFRDVPYCKDSLSEAAQFDERNVHATYIDLNSDGTDELV